ncbi:hypothetical protein [Streptomyces sp. Ag109_G2-15]|uniref:hypothetical protein n=1 Tax=Streptomyces sp. Ag109_G2-15 TaxID=1938850 RepID=UPI000BCDFA59|nr:hypothetical protein [Streptomyces sp. Ag109_G2-15]SOE07367.1 hypothetical protein SAMN06272765_8258 [Streptomyces sp. Ag109_G2-15]
MTTDGPYETLNVRREGSVLVIGLNRPHKRNAFDVTMPWQVEGRVGQRDALDAHRRALRRDRGPPHRPHPGGRPRRRTHVERAIALAQLIARQAPLGVRATLANARLADRESEAAAEAELVLTVVKLFAGEDARIGLESFINRTTAEFVGR